MLWNAFLTFLVFLVVFHLPIIGLNLWVKRNRSGWSPDDTVLWKRGWDYTDYVWLGFGALAIITAAGEVSRILSETELKTLLGPADFLAVVVHKSLIEAL